MYLHIEKLTPLAAEYFANSGGMRWIFSCTVRKSFLLFLQYVFFCFSGGADLSEKFDVRHSAKEKVC